MAVSAKTAHKLMSKKNGSNSTVWNAYADSTAYLWDQNVINEYVIAYELNSGLDYTLQDMLPKVHFDLKHNCHIGLCKMYNVLFDIVMYRTS